jgi:hypothetical protein
LTCCIAWLPVSAPSALTKGSVVDQLPQLLGAALGERVLDVHEPRRRTTSAAL